MITRDNFALYAADFLDGKLSPEDTILFLAFLRENPDLKELLTDLDTLTLKPGIASFGERDSLYKDFSLKTKVTSQNFEEFAIASAENILSQRQEENLGFYLTLHPEKQKDYNLFRKVYLAPDQSLRYPDKKELYHGKKRNLSYFRNAIAVAASLLLLAGLYIFLEKPFSRVHPNQITPLTNLPVSENKPEKVLSSDQPVILSKSKSVVSEVRSKSSQTNFSASKTPTEHVPVSEMVLKEAQPLPFQPIPYSYPSLALPVPTPQGYPESSANITPKTRDEYLSFSELTALALRKRIKQSSAADDSSLTLWDIAEAGVNGLGKLTGTKIRLNKKYDPSGKLVVDFESPLIAFSAPLKKNK